MLPLPIALKNVYKTGLAKQDYPTQNLLMLAISAMRLPSLQYILAMIKSLKMSIFLGGVVPMLRTGYQTSLLQWNHLVGAKGVIFMLDFILIIIAMQKN